MIIYKNYYFLNAYSNAWRYLNRKRSAHVNEGPVLIIFQIGTCIQGRLQGDEPIPEGVNNVVQHIPVLPEQFSQQEQSETGL